MEKSWITSGKCTSGRLQRGTPAALHIDAGEQR
jgi:hypothetical protein